jgi:hypothetical protein
MFPMNLPLSIPIYAFMLYIHNTDTDISIDTYLHMHQMHQMLVVQNGISILVSHYNLSNDFTSLALHMQKSHLEFLEVWVCVCCVCV